MEVVACLSSFPDTIFLFFSFFRRAIGVDMNTLNDGRLGVAAQAVGIAQASMVCAIA